jgi:enoyl-[acyl-carrier-protein] reductase (NADH)
MIEGYRQSAPLKRETGMDDCADAFVMLAKNGFASLDCVNLVGSITGSALTVDAGLSLMSRNN